MAWNHRHKDMTPPRLRQKPEAVIRHGLKRSKSLM